MRAEGYLRGSMGALTLSLRIRRSQVRVLPSAPLKAPQIAGFYSFSNRSWLGRTTYLTTYGLLNALFRDQSGWSLCPSAFRRSDPSPLPECVGVRGRRVS